MRFFLIIALLTCALKVYSGGRLSSEPYLSGDTFRSHCDFIFDETNARLNPKKVGYGHTVFVKTDLLPKFFKHIHPKITQPYVLVTHNSDLPIPGRFRRMLSDKKLLAWFGQNVEGCVHFKLRPIPIGLANRRWTHGKIETFHQIKTLSESVSKQHLLYMNFTASTQLLIRSAIYNQFMDKSYCLISPPTKNLEDYLTDLAMTLFVLSPRGNGLDCHRTWEALYMNAIPIVGSSASDAMYDGLPVIITRDWTEITPEFLEQKFNELSQIPASTEKLWADYWFEQIDAYKIKFMK